MDPRSRYSGHAIRVRCARTPDAVRSLSTSCGVVAVAVHEQKLELAKRLL